MLVAIGERVVRVEQRPLGQQLGPELGVRLVVVDDGRHSAKIAPQPSEAAASMPEGAMHGQQRVRRA